MSFTQSTLAKTSSGFSHIISGGNWTYTSVTDDLTAIKVAGYFDAFAALFTVGEVIQVKDSAGDIELIEVFAVNVAAPRVETKVLAGSNASHLVQFVEVVTTLGGSVDEEFTVLGVVPSDLILTQMISNGAAGNVILEATPTGPADTVGIKFSLNPLATTILSIVVLRAVV